MTKVTGLCTAEGCDRPAVSRPSFCLKHYKRWKRRGTTHDVTPEERFFASIAPGANWEDCWIWTNRLMVGGYGSFSADKKIWLAHRWSYEFMRAPIPDGLALDHLCSNPPCVNPWHLEPVTQRENVLRSRGITAQNARKTHCKWGHEFTEANTYVDRRGRRGCRTCRNAASRRTHPS